MAEQEEPLGHSLLEGVDATTPRPLLIERLRQAGRRLAGYEDKRVDRMQEVTERVRNKWSGQGVDLIELTMLVTPQEIASMGEFLDDFEECLPPGMHRLHGATKIAREKKEVANVDF